MNVVVCEKAIEEKTKAKKRDRIIFIVFKFCGVKIVLRLLVEIFRNTKFPASEKTHYN